MTAHHNNQGTGSLDFGDIPSAAERKTQKKKFRFLLMGCLGVVYGDIGTSPLYAFREAALHTMHDGVLKPQDIYGILSLIVWTLLVIVTLKYVYILLRVDNRGEGGILALMSMAKRAGWRSQAVILSLGLLGAGLFFGDAAITPAISVLSAIEGLKEISPGLSKFVIPVSLGIIIALFMVQKSGTEAVSKYFGPFTGLWFLLMAGIALPWIYKHPEVLYSFNPYYGFQFLYQHSGIALSILGSVFLAVTGAEALYADLGHFGRRPIEVAWVRMVLPCLVLNYMGQGALVLENESLVDNPFFSLVPKYALAPLVVMAGFATIIASQAVITGAYSMARQAVQMGFLPRLIVSHTSGDNMGQIYMPQINRWLCIAVVFLVLLFGSSTALASAYGIAVTGTMVVSTILAFFVIWRTFKKPLWLAACFLLVFLSVESAFLYANLLKVFDGGIVPLCAALLIFMCMSVWIRGNRYLYKKARRQAVSLTDLIEDLERNPLHVVDGTAVYLTSDPTYVPLPMLQNIKHNKVVHAQNIIVNVITSQFPVVPDEQRVIVQPVNSSFVRVYVHYGFMETPDVPWALALARSRGLAIDHKLVSYFVGHRTVVGQPKRGLPFWQEKMFIAMSKMAGGATDYYKLPIGRVVELGMQIAI